jgi:hypothetical protein
LPIFSSLFTPVRTIFLSEKSFFNSTYDVSVLVPNGPTPAYHPIFCYGYGSSPRAKYDDAVGLIEFVLDRVSNKKINIKVVVDIDMGGQEKGAGKEMYITPAIFKNASGSNTEIRKMAEHKHKIQWTDGQPDSSYKINDIEFNLKFDSNLLNDIDPNGFFLQLAVDKSPAYSNTVNLKNIRTTIWVD